VNSSRGWRVCGAGRRKYGFENEPHGADLLGGMSRKSQLIAGAGVAVVKAWPHLNPQVVDGLRHAPAG
jgi:hypothetical protein